MINLLSLKKKSEIKTLLLLRFITGLFFALIATILLLLLSLFPIYIYLNKQELSVKEIENGLNKNENFNQTRAITERINTINSKLKVFPRDLPVNGYFETLINKVVSMRGSGVKITGFNYVQPSKTDQKNTNFEISGVASNRKSLLDFKQKLEIDGSFSEVVLPISSFVKVENIPFSIKLRTK